MRLRSSTGEVMEIPEAFRFLEITDQLGNVGRLVYCDDTGVIREVTAADPEAIRYSKLFKVNFCPIIRLPDSSHGIPTRHS